METWRFDNYSIWIPHAIGDDLEDNNLDIFVTLKSGERYGATLFTLKNIYSLMDRYKQTGECHYGQYFRAKNMVIVHDLKDETILDLIAYLVTKNELHREFGRYEDD